MSQMISQKLKEALNRFSPETILFWTVLCLILKTGIFYLAYTEVISQGYKPTLCAWDCSYYQEIATKGYSYTPFHGTMAFFPLFPLAVKFLQQFTALDFSWTAFALNLSLYAMVLILFMNFSKKLGLYFWWLPSVIWTLDRFTFWAVVPYTEVLFLFFVMLFIVILRQEKINPKVLMLASLVAGLSTAVKLVGVSLMASLGLSRLKYFLQRPLLGLSCLALGLLGVLSFFFYLEAAFGNWKLSLITTSHWNRYFDPYGFFKTSFFLLKSFYFPTVLVTAFTLLWIFKSPLKLLAHERWLMAFLFLIPAVNSIPISITRYLSILFLGHIAWAYFMEQGILSTDRFKRTWALLLGILLMPEVWWQIKLLAKFFRNEVFNWAG